jgi:Ser/Thr protein kinase RdoA (MazF antagonist)
VTDNLIEKHYLPAALEALKAFPIQLEDIQPICLSENVTFRIIPRDSQTHYALRLHRPGYNSLAELNSERQWARALKEAGLAVPESLSTIKGHYFYPVDIPATSERRLSGMTTWLPGIPLNEHLPGCTALRAREQIYRQIGALVAKSHNQSTSWKEPPGFQRRRLDAEGLVGEDPHWGRFWEHVALTRSESGLLQRTRQQIHAVLGRLGMDPSTFSLIHTDLNPDNIVFKNGKLAMIDFDDAAYGWHMYDIASALFDERNHPDFASLRASFFDGYQEHRPLGERQVRTLDLFLLIRGLALIGWLHQRPEHDDLQYFRELRDTMCAGCEKFNPDFTP